MKTICYYLADDGTKFDDEYDCIRYERKKKLEKCKDDFVFYDERKNIIFPEEADVEQICIIVIKTPMAAECVGEWFEDNGYYSPFCGCEFGYEVGTWACGEFVEMGSEWVKLESEIERLQSLIAEVNQ